MKFSNEEVRDLLKSWVAISIAFGIVIRHSFQNFYLAFIVAAFTVGIGFLFHELMHKFVADKYGCYTKYKSFDYMLVFAILLSFTGFIFAAPGAVFISGYVDYIKNGKISAAGAFANLILAAIFFIIGLFSSGFISMLAHYGIMINAWIALFNMIPFGNLDGVKILRWNKVVYGLMIVTGFILLFL